MCTEFSSLSFPTRRWLATAVGETFSSLPLRYPSARDRFSNFFPIRFLGAEDSGPEDVLFARVVRVTVLRHLEGSGLSL